MDEVTNPAPPPIPVVPVPENKVKKRLSFLKDSWRSFSKQQKMQLITVFALVLGLPIILGGVYTVKIFAPRAEEPITPPSTPEANSTPVGLDVEHFDTDLSNWVVETQKPGVNFPSIGTSNPYKGSGKLLLTYTDPSGAVVMRRTLPNTVQNTTFRIYYWDSYNPSLAGCQGGAMYTVDAPGGTPHTGIGINCATSSTSYTFRRNGATDMHSTNIPRSTGWHMFEIIVTDLGTYGKIDDTLLYFGDCKTGNGCIPAVNKDQTSANRVSIIATWGQTGKFTFDELTAVSMPNQSWQEGAYGVLEDFYNRYQAVSFSSLLADNSSNSQSNNIRSLLYTALDFYTYGKQVGNQTAVDKGLNLFKSIVSSFTNFTNWQPNNSDHWWSDVYISPLARSLYLMKGDLDSTAVATAKQLLFREVGKYILFQDNFESNLSGWSSINQTTSNKAIIQTAITHSGKSALALNYTDPASSVSVSRTLPTSPSGTPDSPMAIQNSVHAQIWFYDTMNLKLGAMFSLTGYDGNNTGIGIKNSSQYLFRINTPNQMYPTGINRTPGWHKFDLYVIDDNGTGNAGAGTYGAIDDKPISYVNTSQKNAKTLLINNTWAGLGSSYWDDVLVTRYPDSRYIGNTAAEENGWHADNLAETVNFFPDVPNRDILEPLARCYAYHTITTANDPAYCGIKTVTAYPTFRIDNHNMLNPSYQAAALQELGIGAQSYKATGKPIPTEFTHNVSPAFTKYLTYFNFDSDSYINAPLGDWSGTVNGPFSNGLSVYLYIQTLKLPMPISLKDFMNKRHLFYFQDVGYTNVLHPEVPTLTNFDQTNKGLDSNSTYFWFLDALRSGLDISHIINYYQ